MTTVTVRRIGEGTAIVTVGDMVGEQTWKATDQTCSDLLVDGVVDFVFDLTRVGRYDTRALRQVGDLWRRLHELGCSSFVAVHHPDVLDCLKRVVAARGRWSQHDTVEQALVALLATPVA